MIIGDGAVLGVYTVFAYVRKVGAIGIYTHVQRDLIAADRTNAEDIARQLYVAEGFEVNILMGYPRKNSIHGTYDFLQGFVFRQRLGLMGY